MKKHFVTFYSPGTLFSETTTLPIAEWTVDTACHLACDIVERHGATPYGFRFSTRERGPEDLDSKETAMSALYFLGGKVETLAEIVDRNDPSEEILRSNMRNNEIDRVLVNGNSWKITLPLGPNDVVLEWKP